MTVGRNSAPPMVKLLPLSADFMYILGGAGFQPLTVHPRKLLTAGS